MRARPGKIVPCFLFLGCLALLAQLNQPQLTRADTLLPPNLPNLTPVAPQPLNLETARTLALQKQPGLQSARSGLAAAQAKVRALEELPRLAAMLRKDLPFRRQQASLGVQAAEARFHQIEVETLYAVTRFYWSVVYARAQVRYLDQILEEPPADWKPKNGESLSKLLYLQLALTKLKSKVKRRDTQNWGVDQFSVLIDVIRERREEARTGVQRGLAALREAIGLEPGCPLDVADDNLPELVGQPTREQIVTLALARRDEILQSNIAVAVNELEVQAQGHIHGSRGETFASGTDLHAQPLATAYFGEEYRPGAVGVEMPALLVGSAHQRQEQAMLLLERNRAALDKTRGLITLDADNSYLLWEEDRKRLQWAERASNQSQEISQRVAKDLLGFEDSEAKVSEVLINVQSRAQLLAQARQIRLQMVLHFAALERVTAGGFTPVYRPSEIKKDK